MNPNPVDLRSEDDPGKASHALHFSQISVDQYMVIDAVIALRRKIPN
jgi:hypothetical protein